MLYKFDKSSFKNAIDNLDVIESEFVFIQTQKGKLEIITYDEVVTFLTNIKVLESDESSNIYKMPKQSLKELFNAIYIVKKGIKDKAYIINVNSNNLTLSVCTKDEIKEEQIPTILNYKVEEKLSREDLVKTVLKNISVYTEKLQKKLNISISKLENLDFIVKTSVLEEYNTRSAKVNIENTISLTIPIEKAIDSKIDFDIPENYFITDVLQFKETYNILNRTTVKENFVNAMDNICVKIEDNTCSFYTADIARVSKCKYLLNKKKSDCRMLFNKINLQLLNKTIFKKDDFSINLKVSVNDSKICFETENSKVILKNDTTLNDLKADVLMSTLKMKNISLEKCEIDAIKRECESLKKYIKNMNENAEAIVETSEENAVKVSKPKGLESYKISIQFKENEREIKFQRTFEEVENAEDKYIYNLSYFYSIMSSLLVMNYFQNNIRIYFDDITKIAFVVTFNYEDNKGHNNYLAILPLKK